MRTQGKFPSLMLRLSLAGLLALSLTGCGKVRFILMQPETTGVLVEQVEVKALVPGEDGRLVEGTGVLPAGTIFKTAKGAVDPGE